MESRDIINAHTINSCIGLANHGEWRDVIMHMHDYHYLLLSLAWK